MTAITEPEAPPKPPGLTLLDLMIGIAILAVSFAFLWKLFAAAMAVVVLGIFAAKGLRWPVITDGAGPKRWLPWAVWLLMLAACPYAMWVVHDHYPYRETPHGAAARLRAGNLVDTLGYIHLGLSTCAAVAVMVLTRGHYRWFAWAFVLLMGILTLVVNVNIWFYIVG